MSRPSYKPKVPNRYVAVFRTPGSVTIDLHYANLLIYERWNWERFSRLCKFMRLTPGELASLVCMPHAWLHQFREDLLMPDHLGVRAVCLVLTTLESYMLKEYTNDVIDNPYPNLDALSQDP